MYLVFIDSFQEVAYPWLQYAIKPLLSSQMSTEVKRLKLSKGCYTYALVLEEETNEIIIAEVLSDGSWSHSTKDIYDKTVFKQYKTEEGHNHSFQAYQRSVFAEAISNSLINKKAK